MEVNLNNSFDKYFPYKEQREQQTYAIQKVIEAFMNDDKRFVILEAGTGVGKSAIGLTVARYINRNLITSPDDNIGAGSYFLTTQKILQEQYEKDFGGNNGDMCSLYSASNYKCGYNKKNDCYWDENTFERGMSKFFVYI